LDKSLAIEVEISPVIPTFFWLFYNFDIPLKKELN